MLQNEFEDRIGRKISPEDYQIVETVYVFYPAEMSKNQMAELWKIGGLRLILELYPTAVRMREIEELIGKIRKKQIEMHDLFKEADEKIAYLNECKSAMAAGDLDALAEADALPDDGMEAL